MTTIRRTCPECGGAMTVELLRRDPHDFENEQEAPDAS